jgi:hypothetical protein
MNTYTEEQIKKAFWAVFFESGEKWFPYGDAFHGDHNTSVEAEWDNFLEQLESVRTLVISPDDSGGSVEITGSVTLANNSDLLAGIPLESSTTTPLTDKQIYDECHPNEDK